MIGTRSPSPAGGGCCPIRLLTAIAPPFHHPLPADVVPSGTFKTSDGKFVVIGGNGDSVYSRLMAAIGRPDMAADNPDYANNAKRCARESVIMAQIEGWCVKHTLEQVRRAAERLTP